ncbi:pyruvate ferredoxin oxidoreductase [Candidatus Woesearchaeota archaeon B3_Woes]|nr:MAG: pyruvate ferredoxin oxidoreductase [Candidatus Woesearchaeota archaeon B3_Woes]
MKKIQEASRAVAEAVKLCRPQVIPMYPITPQTHNVEALAEYINNGELKATPILAESEHSVMSAAIGSSAVGARTYTASSSQGIALMNEILFIAAGMRMPIVMMVANRALSAPINIWNDHQDQISVRDTGWIQFFVENTQEAVDTIIQSFKIAEHKDVLLPVMMGMDGFTLSHVFENVEIPSQKNVDLFLPKKTKRFILDSKKPVTMGPIGGPDTYMEIRKTNQDAILNSKKIIKQIHNEFKNKFGRGYGDGTIECYKTKDAQKILICMGTIAGTSKVVVDELRVKGQKVGLMKVRLFRPFPKEEIIKALEKSKDIIVLDRNISLGNNGALFTEIRDCMYGRKCNIKGYVVGLGGRDVTKKHIKKAFNMVNQEWLI